MSLNDLVPLRHLEPDTRLYANARGLAGLRESLCELPIEPGHLVFIGSGDFHHVSLALLERFAQEPPFHLLLIDNHPDWFFERPTYHCGNWVSGALNMKSVAGVTLVGQNSRDFGPHRWPVSPFHQLTQEIIRFHPLTRRCFDVVGRWPQTSAAVGRKKWWGTRLEFQPIRDEADNNPESWITRVIAPLHGRRVYISIDKDVLAPAYARTDWEQGGLRLNELLALLLAVRQHCQIIGADVCGEHAPSRLKGLWKRADAGRLFSHPTASSQGLAANEQANLAIAQLLASEMC